MNASNQLSTGNDTRIAVVGMDCRLPGANSVAEFWQNLVAAKETLTTFTDEQLLASGVKRREFENPHYVRTRGVIDDMDCFDAAFFNVTPRDAELLDPQQRVFLECAWHALEDAGVDPADTALRIAVFGGAGTPYYLVDALGNRAVRKYASGTSIVTSNDRDYLTTRVSFKLDLKGPSMNVQTACSTALVSVVLGIDCLLNHQSDLVLAGGVSLELPPHRGYLYQTGGLQSPDGRCRTFDKDAAGTVFSRGCAVVALKRFADAVADGDHVYAVILGGAVNNDGNRKVSYTAPSVSGQAEVITEAIELAGVPVESINLVEAHGTSTPSGDPIEVASLTQAFRQYTQARNFCRIGSVKTNIGHTDVASGGASLIKVCLSLQHGIAPASLNFNQPNPEIDFEASPFEVNTRTCAYAGTAGAPRRALINSFGVGGTNACLVLEQPPTLPAGELMPRERDLLLLSAHDKAALERLRADVAAHVRGNPSLDLRAFAHTSRCKRRVHRFKAIFPFADATDLCAQLDEARAPLVRTAAADAPMVWMFPGQGNQFPDMGRSLYQSNPVFRETIDDCARLLTGQLGRDIREVLYPDPSRRDQAAELLAQTHITQPAIFMVSYATARVFEQAGLRPDILIGHSVGEYVAAVVAGVMTLEQALLAVAFRGHLIHSLPGGSMLAVLKSESELQSILPDDLDIAVINSPELVVVSGTDEAIAAFAEQMAGQKVFCKKLPTSHAFHSRMMRASLDAYRQHFRGITLAPPQIPIMSTVTGKQLSAAQATDHEYWVQHVVDPVRFGAAAAETMRKESLVFLECGPGHSLESAVRRQLAPQSTHAVISTLKEGVDAVAAVDGALARLWVEDHKVDLAAYFGTAACRKVPFPLLPFARTRYCIDFAANASLDGAERNPRKEDPATWYAVPGWRRTPSAMHAPRLETDAPESAPIWLVFAADPLAQACASTLRQRQQRCIVVRQGSEYQQVGDDVVLDPRQRGDFDRLLRGLPLAGACLRILYGWTHTPGTKGAVGPRQADAMLEASFHAIVRLERSLIEHASGAQVRLLVLADDAFDVNGGTAIRVERALALGPARTLFKEHPAFCSRFINIQSGHASESGAANLVEALLMESAMDVDDAVVSYCGTTRWAECFEPLELRPLEPAIGVDPAALALREGGVYLLTGGAGGIGRTCSRLIAERVRAHFIWTGRRAMPPAQQWDELIAAGEDDELIERLQAIRSIEALGSSVEVHAVECSNLEGMRRLRDDVESRLGVVNGIVHAAGVAGGGVIALREEADFDAVLRPKVHGALVLHELFGDHALDFIQFCSSVTALFGEAGRVDYTSANAFLDAICRAGLWRKARRALSVNWCEWAEVGMGASWEAEKLRRKSSSVRARRMDALTGVVPGFAPSLDRLADSDDACEIRVDIDAAKHWILAEHLLSGQPTMVGTSYLDILRRWGAGRGQACMRIREASFSSPLIAMGGVAPELRLTCSKGRGDSWAFSFASITTDDARKEHMQGEVSFDVVADPPSLAECLARCSGQTLMQRHFTSMSDPNGNTLLHYSQRWDCLEALHVGEDEWVARLELPRQFAADFDHFDLHPAMLDVATSCHFAALPRYRDTYLPSSYGEIIVLAPLTPQMHVWGRPSTRQAEDASRVAFDFVLFDAQSRPVMLVHDYVLARVGSAAPAQARGRKPPAAIKIDAISPEDGKHAFAQLLGQDLAQAIVHPQDFQLEFDLTRLSHVRRKLREGLAASPSDSAVDDRPEIATDFVEPENDIERGIAAIWSAILGVRRIGANDAFNELGGNSLLAIQAIAGIGEEFNVEIKASEFIGSVTVRSLAHLILAKIVEGQDETELLQELLAEQETS
ncbi:type I polyketide synthase [Dokdonella sp.]|uniref:type I polyketide synthase n=1 Tax=Dokdonella sp. TaxID=2291710 RepID=UPI0025C3A388|nr:type I polyketide synthase [Dokdonella sp.]MBX3688622.1 acyltransferase domain-containing protein [Dokdonella sp.]